MASRCALSIPMSLDGPRLLGQPSRLPPLRTLIVHNFAWTGDPATGALNDDTVTMGLQSCTHWDALSHVGLRREALQRLPQHHRHRRGRRHPLRHRQGGPARHPWRAPRRRPHARRRAPRARRHHRPRRPRRRARAADHDLAPGDAVLVRTGLMGRSWPATAERTSTVLRGSPPRRRGGSGTTTWPCTPSTARTRIPSRPRTTRSSFPSTSSHCATWACCRARTGISTRWPRPAPPTAATASSSTPRPEPFVGASGAPVAPVAVR
jgi:hypothetical protein